MTNINLKALAGLAITTAFHQRDWTPGTCVEEVLDQDPKFMDLIVQASANLDWVNVVLDITEYDVAQAIWGMDSDQLDEIYAEMDVA
jgi:hypothetical protein